MNLDRIPERNDVYQLEDIEGELMLYNAGSVATIYLNEPAAMVWYLCDGKRSAAEIVTLLVESYPDAGSSVATDVQEILEQFESQGCIVLRAP